MKEVTVWTDGACSGNPGPGGWAAILRYGDAEKELHGGEAKTTNNRMELTAVLEALKALKQPCNVTINSDSKYVVDAVTLGWAESWQRRGWMRSKTEKAKNPELWEELLGLLKQHQVRFHWVKGHADCPENERCDRLAVMESQKFK